MRYGFSGGRRNREFVAWVNEPDPRPRQRFGELVFECNEVYSYAMHIATVLRGPRLILWNECAAFGNYN